MSHIPVIEWTFKPLHPREDSSSLLCKCSSFVDRILLLCAYSLEGGCKKRRLHSTLPMKSHMNFQKYKDEFTKEASNSGYSEQNIRKCLEYAEVLFKNKVPVIYNTSHLSALVGYKKSYLKKAVSYTSYFYRDFFIKKKNGTRRRISEPLPSLKEIQLWILDNILYNIEISPYAKAYKKNVRIIDNVKYHANQDIVVTVDIQNFFPSITKNWITVIFKQFGYSDIISNLLAGLCSRDEELPQGAPTSPYLSNIFFKTTDDKIASYCSSRKIKYTRYADDLSFSGNFDEKELLSFLRKVIIPLGLRLNEDKTKVMRPYQRQIVTGIVVNDKPQVVFQKRNKLRQEMYYIIKYGIKDHMKRQNIKKNNYVKHLLGRINFILQINPHDVEFQNYKSFLYTLEEEDIL